MKQQNNKFYFRLGIFVVTAMAILIIGIFWIGKQKNLFDPTFRVYADYGAVSGLQVGNNVRYAGINVGTVDGIEIKNDSTIRVELILKKDVQQFIKADAIASIGSEGLMGDRIVTISTGAAGGKSLQNGGTLQTIDPTETEEIMGNLKTTSENASVITDELADIMYKINNGEGTLGRLINDSTIAESFARSAKNIQSGTKGFSENMEAAKNNFLLRGYFKKKQREQERLKKEQEKIQKEKAEEKQK